MWRVPAASPEPRPAAQARLQIGDLVALPALVATRRRVAVRRVDPEDLAVASGTPSPVTSVLGGSCLGVAVFQVGRTLFRFQVRAGPDGQPVRVCGGRVEAAEFRVHVQDCLPLAGVGVVAQFGPQVGHLLSQLARRLTGGCVAVGRIGLQYLAVPAGSTRPVARVLGRGGQRVGIGELPAALGGIPQPGGVGVVRVEDEQVVEQADRGVEVLEPQLGARLDVERAQLGLPAPGRFRGRCGCG